MAWFKCSGGGIPAILKTRMNNVFNKKFGTSTTYQPDGWPDNVNLMGPLEEKTVSGSIVAFSDGADDVPLKSCAVTIAPNLDGVSSVDVVHGVKNFVDDTLDGLEQGSISSGTGLNANSNNRVRNADYIPFPLDKIQPDYVLTIPSGYKIAMRFYDKNKNFITPPAGAQGFINSIPSGYVGEGVAFARFILAKTDDSNITPNDMKNVGFQIEVGSTASTYTEYVEPTTHTANLGRTIYGGEVDVVNGTGTDENGNDFTFTPVPIISRLGDNTLWGDGDLSVVYRSSGTQTVIPPVLTSKMITANGTYSAEDDGVDGYDEVTVNVPQGGGGNTPQATQTLICDNSALGSTLTFTDDYENYDLIKFVVYRSDVQNTFVFYATPNMINACWQYSSNRINFNQPYGNNFVCYQKSSNTSWSRYGVRNMAVQYVYGLTFTNCTVAETELYNRQDIGSSSVTFTPPTGESFLDYDYILFMTCTGNSDETQVNLEVFQPEIEKDIFGSDNVKENTVTVYRYNTGGTTATVTENTITSYQYFYASGLKLNFNQQNLLGGSLNSSNSEELNESNNEEEESENESNE